MQRGRRSAFWLALVVLGGSALGAPGPAAEVRAVAPLADTSSGFADVPGDAFFAAGAGWLKEQGFTTGYNGDPNKFAPDVLVTRGQMAAFLWRISGEPPAAVPCGFGDVPAGVFFEVAACWLKEAGITTGYAGDPTVFAPDVVVDRGQMAAFLWRWVRSPPPVGTVAEFGDVERSAFFAAATLWLKQREITTGYGNDPTVFAPGVPINRGQMAAFLHRIELGAPSVNEPADEVVVIDADDVTFEEFDRDGESRFVYTGDEPMEVGAIVVLLTDDGPFYGRIIDIDGDVVTTEPASLAEVIPELDVDLDVPIEDLDDETIDLGDIGVASVSPTAGPVTPTTVSAECSVTNGSSYDLDVTFDPGRFILDVDWSWRGGIDGLEVAYVPQVAASATATAGGSVTCSFSADLFDRSLPTIRFSIGPVPVWIEQDVSADAHGSFTASGSITGTATANAQGRYGISISKDDGFELLNEFDFDADTTLTVDEAELTATASLPITYRARAYGLVGFDATAGPRIDLGITPLNELCLTLDGALEASVTFTHDLPFLDDYRSYTIGPDDLYDQRFVERYCGVEWTGTITVSMQRRHADVDSPEVFGHFVESATYVLAGIVEGSPDGSGAYSAQIDLTGSELRHGYCPGDNPPVPRTLFTHSWQGQVARRDAIELVYDLDAAAWRYRPLLIPGAPNHEGESGAISGPFVVEECGIQPESVPQDVQPSSVLGWNSGSSSALELLDDDDPDPDRLVGTTTWDISSGPAQELYSTIWTYTATYDLTRVDT
jgi:hypothetical protein